MLCQVDTNLQTSKLVSLRISGKAYGFQKDNLESTPVVRMEVSPPHQDNIKNKK